MYPKRDVLGEWCRTRAPIVQWGAARCLERLGGVGLSESVLEAPTP